MFDHFGSSTLLIRTMALYFILLLLPRSVLGDTWYGTGVFKSITIVDYQWHFENGNAIVDLVNTRGWKYLEDYPCRQMWGLKTLGGTFKYCMLIRDIGGNYVELGTYTKIDQLTKGQLQAFVNQTGVMGPAYPNGRRAQFSLSLMSSNGNSAGDYLPSQSGSGGGGIPPTEVEPPLSCNLSDGSINHGVIDSAITDGHVSRSNISVWCTKHATVRINASSYSPSNGIVLKGPGVLKSFVTLNGVAANTGVNVDVNTSTSVSVESRLQGAGNIAGGSYSGSMTLVATII